MMVTVKSDSPAEQEKSFPPCSDDVVGFVFVVVVSSSAVSVVDAVVLVVLLPCSIGLVSVVDVVVLVVVVLSCSIVLLSWLVVGLDEVEGSGVLNPEQASHESAPGHKSQAADTQRLSQPELRQNWSVAPTIAWQLASLHPVAKLAAKQLLSQISEAWLVVLKVLLCCSEVVLASGVVVEDSEVVLASGVVVAVSEVVLASGVVVEDEPSETTNETVSLNANSPPSKTSSSTIKV